MTLFPVFLALVTSGGLVPSTAHAVDLAVSLDTSALPAGAQLAFDLIGADDGSGNNSATISGFSPVGALSGGPSCDPPASCSAGSLDTFITMTDADILVTLLQGITAGEVISFSLDVTSNFDPPNSGVPDSLSMSILDANGDPLVTTYLFVDSVLFLLELDGSPTGILTVAGSTDPDVSLFVVPAVAIPGPGALLLMAAVIPVILRGRLGRRRA